MRTVLVGLVTGLVAVRFGGWQALLWVFLGFVNGMIVFEGPELWREIKSGIRQRPSD